MPPRGFRAALGLGLGGARSHTHTNVQGCSAEREASPLPAHIPRNVPEKGAARLLPGRALLPPCTRSRPGCSPHTTGTRASHIYKGKGGHGQHGQRRRMAKPHRAAQQSGLFCAALSSSVPVLPRNSPMPACSRQWVKVRVGAKVMGPGAAARSGPVRPRRRPGKLGTSCSVGRGVPFSLLPLRRMVHDAPSVHCIQQRIRANAWRSGSVQA